MFKKTKIVATISDKNCTEEFIEQLFKSGMNVVRLNTAHQSPNSMCKVIGMVRAVSPNIAILIDTKGPEVRTTVCDNPIDFQKGDKVCIAGDITQTTTKECIYVSYPDFVKDIEVGKHILFDDGTLEVIVEGKEEGRLVCVVQNNATLGARKSVNVPGVRVNLPALTERDKENIRFAKEMDIAFIAHSFVRSKEDVLEVRQVLGDDCDIRIIAKIENQEGVDNIKEILEVADGIMVARGDLGIEVPQEFIPGIQRKLVYEAIKAHKPVIVATQMLQSMIDNPRPTRTEVTDIANAVYMRADALMLSGETAYGAYPVQAVRTMATIARQAEKDTFEHMGDMDFPLSPNPDETEFFAKEAVRATRKLKPRAIIMDSYSGKTARYVSSFRGDSNILAICYKEKTVRHLALSYGVEAFYMPMKSFGHEFLLEAVNRLRSRRLLTVDDRIVYLGSHRKEQSTTFMEITKVGDLLKQEEEEGRLN